MLPPNVGHQPYSQNNFKTAGCMHSITMLTNNYPMAKICTLHQNPFRGTGWKCSDPECFEAGCFIDTLLWARHMYQLYFRG